MFEDLINKYFFILFSLLPISIIAGPSISLGNVLIIVFSFLVYVTIIKEWSWIKLFVPSGQKKNNLNNVSLKKLNSRT